MYWRTQYGEVHAWRPAALLGGRPGLGFVCSLRFLRVKIHVAAHVTVWPKRRPQKFAHIPIVTLQADRHVPTREDVHGIGGYMSGSLGFRVHWKAGAAVEWWPLPNETTVPSAL